MPARMNSGTSSVASPLPFMSFSLTLYRYSVRESMSVMSAAVMPSCSRYRRLTIMQRMFASAGVRVGT